VREALIWDLDGTLMDSYPLIAGAVEDILAHHGHPMDHSDVLAAIKSTSVGQFLAGLSGELGESPEALYAEYRGREAQFSLPPLLPGAKECLEALGEMGCTHFVFTHKGTSALEVLEGLGIASHFREVVSVAQGFPRKPDPAALRYLMDKYHLDPAHTWYVGDRDVDAQCGKNAGVRTALLSGPYLTEGADVVESLEELPGCLSAFWADMG